MGKSYKIGKSTGYRVLWIKNYDQNYEIEVRRLLFLLLFGLDLTDGILALPYTLLLLLHLHLCFTGRLRRGSLGKISCGTEYFRVRL